MVYETREEKVLKQNLNKISDKIITIEQDIQFPIFICWIWHVKYQEPILALNRTLLRQQTLAVI